MFKAEIGLTLKMAAGGGFNFFRPLIGIDGIDPNGDVDAQIAKEIEGIKKAWPQLESTIITIVNESEVAEKESVLIELKKELKDFSDRLITVESAMTGLKSDTPNARRKTSPR